MSMRLLSVALAALVLPGVATAQAKKTAAEHPYAKAKVGDWITYATIVDVMGMKVESSTTLRVAVKDNKLVTLKVSSKIIFMGMTTDVPETEAKIDLTEKFVPPGAAVPAQESDDIKVEKLGEGKEKLKISGKEYDCTWTKTKYTTKNDDKQVSGEVTVWITNDVPFGMVKMVSKGDFGNTTMELKEIGTGKK